MLFIVLWKNIYIKTYQGQEEFGAWVSGGQAEFGVNSIDVSACI